MSTAKVIFTYKRKRLSSCSGLGHADVCTEFSLDVQAGKHQNVPNEKIKSPEIDLMIYKHVSCNDMDCSRDCRSCLEPYDNQLSDFKLQHGCHGEEMPPACSSFAIQNSSRLGEKYDVQISDTTNTSKMVLSSHEITGGSTLKTSDGDNTAEGSLGEATNSVEKDSCLLHSSCMDIAGCMQGSSASQSVEKDSNNLSKECCLSKTKVAKLKSIAPLRTFSRRMKRKADVYYAGMFTKLSSREGDTAIQECDPRPVSSCTCEVASNKSKLAENSQDMNFHIRDMNKRNMLCHSSEEMTSNKIRDSPHPCRQSCAETVITRQTGETSDPDALGSISLLKDDVRGSTYDGTVISCNVACKMDEQPMSSEKCGASSGDSQVTSSDSSPLKIVSAKRVECRAHSNSMNLDLSHPSPGAFVIDCNVVPESDVQEEASDIIQDSLTAKNSEKAVQEKNNKRKSLELFGDNCVQVDDSSGVVFTSVNIGSKHKTKSLQLFSEDGKFDQSIPSLQSESGYSKVQQNAALVLDSQRYQLEQSSSKESVVLGSSLPLGPLYNGQTSKDVPAAHLFQNSNVRTCHLIQDPVEKSFLNQTSFQDKLVLESINNRATSLRGNRNISLDKLEPCPAMWFEEELDSLWIGIRRHGKGNWHAMILDPRLRFAPWRTAGDLEEQWGREQNKLYSGQHMPSSKYLKPQDAYKLHCHGPVCHRSVASEIQLSLGDVYAHTDGVFSGSAPSYGITQVLRHATMASNLGPSACGLFNNVQANAMIRGEVSSSGQAMGMNNCFPRLRNPFGTSMPLAPSLPPISALPQGGGHRLDHAFPEIPGAPLMKNLINTKLAGVHKYPPSHLQHGNPITTKSGLADNFIVIDSDASSEGTISDDRDNRC